MKEDALFVFFLLCALFGITLAIKNNNKKWLLASGLASGLACGTKYTGSLTSVLLLSSPLLFREAPKEFFKSYWKVYLCSLLCIPLFFVLTTPYSVLDYTRFLNGLASEQKHMLRGHTGEITGASQYWMYHMLRSALPGIGLPAMFLALIGIGVSLIRKRKFDLLLVAIVFVFYFPAEWVRAKPAPQAERYMMPLVPILAIFVAQGFRVLFRLSKLPLAKVAVSVIALLGLIVPLSVSIRLADEVSNDTRDIFSKWISQNIPKNSKIARAWAPYDPPFSQDKYQISNIDPGAFVFTLQSWMSDKTNSKVDYVVLSSLLYDRQFSQPSNDTSRPRIYEKFFKTANLVHQIKPLYGTYGFHNPTLTLFKLSDGAKTLNQVDVLAKQQKEARKVSSWLAHELRPILMSIGVLRLG
jgi:4-amino-4-deoxy-L-arabinose transferase-like glycosyltransferase